MDNKSGDKIGNTGENIVDFGAYKEGLVSQGIDAEKVLRSMGENDTSANVEMRTETELGKIETVEQRAPETVGAEKALFSIDGIKIDDKGLNAAGMTLVREGEKCLNNGDVTSFYENIRNAVPEILEHSYADRAGAVEKMGKVA